MRSHHGIGGSELCFFRAKESPSTIVGPRTQERVCALIDATDSFDPRSAQAIGVHLHRLLWVRCSGKDMKALEQAFRCADLVLQASGVFGVIAVDLSGIASRFVRKVPLTTWFRFRGVIEKQETALVFSTSYGVTSTCSELVLRLAAKDIHWSQTADNGPTHARVFAGFDLKAEITRKRSFKKPVQSAARTLVTYPRWA